MTITREVAGRSASATAPRWPGRARRAVGGFFLSMGGVHVGLVAAGPQVYRHFADGSFLPWVRTAWAEVFMAAPAWWGGALAVGETAIGVLLLVGGRPGRIGLVGAIGFHVALLLFGPGTWLWCVPALAGLWLLARADRTPRSGTQG